MTYNPNIPQAGDRPSSSQGDILMNFQELNTQFSINHTSLISSSANGKHFRIDLPVQGADPALTTATDGILYTKDVSGETQLFYRNNVTVEQITSSQGGGSSPTQNGFVYLQGGMLLNWGVRTFNIGVNNINITFIQSFSVPAFNVTATASVSGGANPIATVQTLSTTGFNLNCSESSVVRLVYWQALGRA